MKEIGIIEGRPMVDAKGAVGKTIAKVCEGKDAVLISFTDGTVATIEGQGDGQLDPICAEWTPLGWSAPNFDPYELHAAGLIDAQTMSDRQISDARERDEKRIAALRQELANLERYNAR